MEEELQRQMQEAMEKELQKRAENAVNAIPNPFVENAKKHLWYVVVRGRRSGPYEYDDAFKEVTHMNMGLRLPIASMEIVP